MIKFYNTEAEYAAATKSAFESEISLVGESNISHFDGRNVVVGAKSAVTGSIAVLDGNSALHFISADTFSSTSFMSNFTVVGVVAVGVDDEDFRGDLLIVHKTNASKKWSEIYSFRLTGYTLDGTDRTGVLSIREASDSWAANHTYTVSYNATTIASLVSQLNTYFQATAPFTTQSWVAVAVDTNNDDVADAIDLKFLFSTWQQAGYNSGNSGFALTANLLPGITPTTAMLRMNGQRSGEGTITNMPRALSYFNSDLSSTTYNPSSNITTTKITYPICKPGYLGTSAYQSDHCAYLRGVYGAGEAGWRKFMESFLPVRPTRYGSVGDKATYGDGLTNTYLMDGVKFTKQNGDQIDAFPAATYCASVVYNHELLTRGKWFLPDIDTVFAIMKHIEYGTTNNRNADPINKALYAIGGSAISNGSGVWSSSRGVAYHAWRSAGALGFAYGDYFDYSCLCVPSLLLNVAEGDS